VALYLAYLAATIVLVLTPGATTAVVVRNTLASGHRAGVMAATGAAVANTTHATLAGLGLWVLVGHWPAVLDALRLGGAAYLAWLGLKSLARAWPRSRPVRARHATAGAAPLPSPTGDPASFLEGLTVNVLNPAIISFYLAVVPTFVSPSPPRGYFALLAASHVSMALACHSAWAYALHTLRQIFARPMVPRALELMTAAAMLWLSSRVLGQL
jgi:homoserine/homoserine lactone efflux protein